MYVASMVARRVRRRAGWHRSGKRIDPRARTKQVVPSVLISEIRIGAARTQLCERSAIISVAAEVTVVAFVRAEGVFNPRLTNLFHPLGVICTTAHPIKILGEEGMICVW